MTGKARGGARTGYRDIAAVLTGEISDGAYPIGSQLPTEAELVGRFAVSRHTVREALRSLQDAGLLGKRRGTRSVVLRSETDKSFVNSIRSVDELMEYAHAADNRLIAVERVTAAGDEAQRLDCAEGRAWLRYQVLRSRRETPLPFCYSEVFLDPRYAAATNDHGSIDGIYAAVEARCGIVFDRVVQEIEPVAASETVALHLQVPVGAPILMAQTRFFGSDGELIEVGVGHFAAGRYRLRIALDRPDR